MTLETGSPVPLEAPTELAAVPCSQHVSVVLATGKGFLSHGESVSSFAWFGFQQDCDMGQEQHHCTRLSRHSCCYGKVSSIGFLLSKTKTKLKNQQSNTNGGVTGATVGWEQVGSLGSVTGQQDTDFLLE